MICRGKYELSAIWGNSQGFILFILFYCTNNEIISLPAQSSFQITGQRTVPNTDGYKCSCDQRCTNLIYLAKKEKWNEEDGKLLPFLFKS